MRLHRCDWSHRLGGQCCLPRTVAAAVELVAALEARAALMAAVKVAVKVVAVMVVVAKAEEVAVKVVVGCAQRFVGQ